jgi:hypothetical protein
MEAGIAGAVLLPACRAWAALAAAGLWSLYLALILRALAAGRRDLDCGCAFGVRRNRIGAFEVSRNLLLIAAAIGVASASRNAPPPIGVMEVLAALAMLSLYAGAEQTAALASRPQR